MSDDSVELQTREEFWPGGALRARWSVRVLPDGQEVRHGLFESFFDNGMRDTRGFYAQGEPAELWTTWDRAGRHLQTGPYAEPAEADVPEPDPSDWDEPIVPEATASPTVSRLLEFGVVMALAWLVPMTYGILSSGVMLDQTEWVTEVEVNDWAAFWECVPTFATSLQVFVPLLYIISKSDLKWSEVGVTRPTLIGLLVFGPLLAGLTLGADELIDRAFDLPDVPGYYSVPGSAAAWCVFALAMLANSLAEEFVWRGYVLQRLKQMSGSPVFALLLSSFLFATYHVYQGPVSVPVVMLFGIIWGASVLITKRIWPAVVAHTIHNIVVTALMVP